MKSGDFPPLRYVPSLLQLARFSSATWNFHRIHVDAAAAAEDGLPGPVVQSTLFAEMAWQAVRQWLAESAPELTESAPELVAIEWRNVRPVPAQEPITWVCLEVTSVAQPTGELVTVRLAALGQDDQTTVEATVTVRNLDGSDAARAGMAWNQRVRPSDPGPLPDAGGRGHLGPWHCLVA
jgi:acyl dehydratase